MTMSLDARLSQECMSHMLSLGGWKTVWKTLEFNQEREALQSPYQKHYYWEPGWLDAGGSAEDHARHQIVYQGQTIDGAAIHVYFTKPKHAVDEWSRFGGCPQTLVPVRAHIDDFIGAGGGDTIVATFRRVFLNHADCELAVKDCILQLEGRPKKPDTISEMQDMYLASMRSLAQQTQISQFIQPSVPRTADLVMQQQQHALQQQMGPGSIMKLTKPTVDFGGILGSMPDKILIDSETDQPVSTPTVPAKVSLIKKLFSRG